MSFTASLELLINTFFNLTSLINASAWFLKDQVFLEIKLYIFPFFLSINSNLAD